MIDYKELVEACGINSTAIEAESETSKPKARPQVNYIPEMISGCDFAIRCKGKRKELLLIALVSMGELKLKNIVTDEVLDLTGDLYAKFMTDAPEDGVELRMDDSGNVCSWLPKLLRGKQFGEFLICCAKYSWLRELIKNGYVYAGAQECRVGFYSCPTIENDILDQIFKVSKELGLQAQAVEALSATVFVPASRHDDYHEDTRVNRIKSAIHAFSGSVEYIAVLRKWGGISGIRDIIYAYMSSAVSYMPSLHHWKNLFSDNRTPENFNLKRTLEYVFFQSTVQGYAFNIDAFMHTWKDTLNMQQDIYGHITDKYPENLASEHQILSYKHLMIKQKIDKENWAKVTAEMAVHEKQGRDFMIVAPKTPSDMVDEARMQSNCLSSYVTAVTNGECQIYFLRKKTAPDKSFVTIEIRKDGSLGQVLGKFNRAPDTQAMNFVQNWWKEQFSKKEKPALPA